MTTNDARDFSGNINLKIHEVKLSQRWGELVDNERDEMKICNMAI